MPQIVIRGPAYFSSGDEKAFFEWLQAIPCVSRIGGQAYDLHITLRRAPTDSQLRELLALFYRYRMNMKVLAVFKTTRNAAWFANNKSAFWHKRVFGPTRR